MTSLHPNGFALGRACGTATPAGAWARKPALPLQLPPQAVAEPAGSGWIHLGSVEVRHPIRIRRPVSEAMPGRRRWARRPGSSEVHPNHDAGSSPCVVVCAAGYPRSCQRRGARYRLPRGGRHPLYNPGRSSPLNKDAALARDGRGEHYDADNFRNGNALCWDAPPTMKRPPPDAPQMVGNKVGRLVVMGMMVGHASSGKSGRWVVRCACGTYTTRTARALRNPANVDDMCARCDRTRILRKRAANPQWVRARGVAP